MFFFFFKVFFTAAWEELGANDLVLDMISRGYRLELVGPCPRGVVVTKLPKMPDLRAGMVEAVEGILLGNRG